MLRSTGCRRAGFSSCGTRALERRLSSCGARALLLRGLWDLPGPGLEPVCPALAGGFLTTVPPGKSQKVCFILFYFFLRDDIYSFSKCYSKTRGKKMVLAVRKKKKKCKSGVWPLKVIYNNVGGGKTRSCFTLQTSPQPQSLILAYKSKKRHS